MVVSARKSALYALFYPSENRVESFNSIDGLEFLTLKRVKRSFSGHVLEEFNLLAFDLTQ